MVVLGRRYVVAVYELVYHCSVLCVPNLYISGMLCRRMWSSLDDGVCIKCILVSPLLFESLSLNVWGMLRRRAWSS